MTNKKKIIIAISFFLACSISALFIVFIYNHKTYYKYNDSWVIGKSMEEIEERYGECDEFYKDYNGKNIYMGYEVRNIDIGDLLWGDDKDCYYIFFDSDGVAETVEIYRSVEGRPLDDENEESNNILLEPIRGIDSFLRIWGYESGLTS